MSYKKYENGNGSACNALERLRLIKWQSQG